jgi:hypothetical protein
MDAEIGQLEQKVATLIAHAREMGAANESLRRDLAAVRERNRDLLTRMHEAGARLDTLLARIPDA